MHEKENNEKRKINIEIRESNQSDAEAIARLYKETWLETYPNVEFGVTTNDIEEKVKNWLSPEYINQWRERLAGNNPNILQLTSSVNGEVAGHSVLYKTNSGPNKLETIYVLSKYQGSDIAKILLNLGLDWLGNEKDVILEVAKYNSRAIHFYEKMGFRIIGDTESSEAILPSGIKIPEYMMIKNAY